MVQALRLQLTDSTTRAELRTRPARDQIPPLIRFQLDLALRTQKSNDNRLLKRRRDATE
jgi:hypothetical protein